MANVFLMREPRDTETAIMLENALVLDIGKAVAYTDGKQVFINTEDNLTKILPRYSNDMLKWLLWHERLHMELSHHHRFFTYLEELRETKDKFNVSKQEVNIIMDILVHDTLSKWFPELVETAIENLAQMRNRNSLGYTFTTSTLEEMLDEYKRFKEDEDSDKDEGKGDDTGESKEESKGDKSDEKTKEEPSDEPATDDSDKGRGKSKEKESDTTEEPTTGRPEDGEPTIDDTATKPEPTADEHDKTDWSKLKDIDDKEFISKNEADIYREEIEELKRKKFKLATLTKTLNGLVTSERIRTYAKPNPIRLAGGVVLKGSVPGKTQLYLCFDASGSMGGELSTFKDIISKSIPQAMECPCEWFSGRGSKISPYKTDSGEGYYKGKFKDIMPVRASSGYSDDGDRTIELCYQAEQLGYSPIGVTDGGGQISWSKDKLKLLKRTVFVGQNEWWLKKAQSINPRVQILHI